MTDESNPLDMDPIEEQELLSNKDNKEELEDDILLEDEEEEQTKDKKEPSTNKPNPYKKETIHQNIQVTFDFSHPVEWKDDNITIDLPPSYQSEAAEAIERMNNVNIADSEESSKWTEVLENGFNHITFGEVYKETLSREDSIWAQGVDYKGNNIIGKVPKMKSISNTRLSGERANIRLLSHLGLGSVFRVYLYHSGFSVTFKPPTESEIVELYRRLARKKIQVGNITHGIALSNVSSFTAELVLDFITDHIYNTSINLKQSDSILDYIAVQDYQIFIWGFLCSMYPNGFQYRRPCINNPESCNYVLEELLSLDKLIFVDKQALTDEHKSLLVNVKPNTISTKEVKKYQTTLSNLATCRKTIYNELGKELHISIKSPSLSEYIESGHVWLDDIIEMVEKLPELKDDESRNTHVKRYAQSTMMAQYAYWVDEIEFDSITITDKETILDVLGSLSSDDKLRTDFIEKVLEYINDSTIATIAIPNYVCPECQSEQLDKPINNRFKNAVPLDMQSLFFTLKRARMEKIIQR